MPNNKLTTDTALQIQKDNELRQISIAALALVTAAYVTLAIWIWV